jgi:biotin carboxyl carrier protein
MKKTALILIISMLAFTNLAISKPISVQTSVLSGVVFEIVSVGQEVKEGTPLVVINSIVGKNVAARANIDGTVTDVLAKRGDTIYNGDIVVRIESK